MTTVKTFIKSLAMLMHASFDVSTVTILVPVVTGVAFLTWFLVLTALLWVVVVAVALANRWQPSRQPFRRQLA
jgi:hypothetical protein